MDLAAWVAQKLGDGMDAVHDSSIAGHRRRQRKRRRSFFGIKAVAWTCLIVRGEAIAGPRAIVRPGARIRRKARARPSRTRRGSVRRTREARHAANLRAKRRNKPALCLPAGLGQPAGSMSTSPSATYRSVRRPRPSPSQPREIPRFFDAAPPPMGSSISWVRKSMGRLS